ncbi:MAG: tail fiber domain-containing protein, partial [Patescibacteria group bacterium]
IASDTTPFVITNTGAVGIGKTSPSYALDVLASGTGVIARFNSANTTGCTLADGGTITCTSDERLKKNIVSFESGLDALMSLRPVTYNWNYEDDGTAKSFGFIAQEVETIFPKLVMTQDNGFKELNTIGLIPIIAQAVREQQGIIETQTTDILGLSLKTDQNITTIAELQASVDTQLTIIGTELAALQVRGAATDDALILHDTRLSTLETLTSQLELDMNTQASKTALLETQMQTLIDFYTTFDLNNLVAKDVSGNVDLLEGKLRAKVLETGALAIEVVDPLAPTIGTATILPIVTDADNDGIDDDTGADGKSVTIGTTAITEAAKIFTNFTKNPGAYSWTDKKKNGDGDYAGFIINLSAITTAPVKVDWWIVESK